MVTLRPVDAPPARRYRLPLGIFEAGLLLVFAAGGLWLARPLGSARRAAAAEKEILAVIGAVADAEDAKVVGGKGSFLPLDRLSAEPAVAKTLAGFAPSPVAGVLGNRSYWLTVLLPGPEGGLARVVPDRLSAAGGASLIAPRGYAVVAWPRSGAAAVLRALAALPEGNMWQRADGMEESGDPAIPPVPRAAFPGPGNGGPRVPDPPPDWVQAKKRR